MRGHLEDRGKNVWRAKVYTGRQSGGRRLYVTRTIHGTKRFAEAKLAELLIEVGRTDEVTTDGTLADLVQQWRPIAEVNLSPTTKHADGGAVLAKIACCVRRRGHPPRGRRRFPKGRTILPTTRRSSPIPL